MNFYAWTIEDEARQSLMVGAVADSESEARERIAKELEECYEHLRFDMRKEPSPCDAIIPVNDLVIIVPDDDFIGDQLLVDDWDSNND